MTNDPNYMICKNPLQGIARRVLFVCTGGILRSATASHWAASNKGWNTRCAGTHSMALIPVTSNLLEWAEKIYCMERMHFDVIVYRFGVEHEAKMNVLDIKDDFNYMDPALIRRISAYFKSLEAKDANQG